MMTVVLKRMEILQSNFSHYISIVAVLKANFGGVKVDSLNFKIFALFCSVNLIKEMSCLKVGIAFAKSKSMQFKTQYPSE